MCFKTLIYLCHAFAVTDRKHSRIFRNKTHLEVKIARKVTQFKPDCRCEERSCGGVELIPVTCGKTSCFECDCLIKLVKPRIEMFDGSYHMALDHKEELVKVLTGGVGIWELAESPEDYDPATDQELLALA